jgi:5'(3')-deoxyribonucleotidase
LIDDEARHFRSFRGNGILFSAPHNLLETAYQRVASWQDIRRKFVGLQTTDTPTKRNQLVSTSDQ